MVLVLKKLVMEVSLLGSIKDKYFVGGGVQWFPCKPLLNEIGCVVGSMMADAIINCQ